jgi:hypothetical protein
MKRIYKPFWAGGVRAVPSPPSTGARCGALGRPRHSIGWSTPRSLRLLSGPFDRSLFAVFKEHSERTNGSGRNGAPRIDSVPVRPVRPVLPNAEREGATP